MIDLELWLRAMWLWSSTPCTPSVGGGLNSPRGGPPPPPHLCARMLGDCHALKACICRTALLKAHGEMKAHILATICPDFAMNLKTLVRNTFLPKEPRKRRTFSKNRSQNSLKSRFGASKIEPGDLQDAIFQDV